MSMFNNLGKKLGEAAELTASKAKQLSEIVKLNAYISAEETEIEVAYLEIGKFVYEQGKDQATGYLAELCGKIQESKGKIDEYKAQIEQVKNS